MKKTFLIIGIILLLSIVQCTIQKIVIKQETINVEVKPNKIKNQKK